MELRKVSFIKEKVLAVLGTFRSLPISVDARQYVDELRGNVEKENFVVAVVATWNTGKSTFINALQAEPLLPTQNKETTHIVNRLCYSSKRYVTIHFVKNASVSVERAKTLIQNLGLSVKDKNQNSIVIPCSRYQDQRALLEIFSTDDGYLEKYCGTYKMVFAEELLIPFPDLEEIVTQYRGAASDSDGQSGEGRFDRWVQLSAHFKSKCLRKIQQDIVEIELGVPLPNLKHGVQLLDTPGAVSFEEMRDEILENYIKFAQCVVFVFRFDQPGAMEDIEFRRIVQECGIEDVFLVLNRIDCAQNRDELWDAVAQIRQNLHQFVHGQIYLYPISALGALTAKIKRGLRKGKESPFLRKYSLFVERTSDEQLNEYAQDLQKFSEDLDNYLVKVDKFRKIMNAPLNFIESAIGSLNNKFDAERKDATGSVVFQKLEHDEKHLAELWDEWSEQINSVMHRMEEMLEGRKDEPVNEEHLNAIINANEIMPEIFEGLAKSGFSVVFGALFSHLMNGLRARSDQWIASNSSGAVSIRAMEEFMVPEVSKILETSTRLLNCIVKNYHRCALESVTILNKNIRESVESLIPVSFTLDFSELSVPSASQAPEVKIPLPSFWQRALHKGRRILQKNERDWREEIKIILAGAISGVEKQANDYYQTEVNNYVQKLLHQMEKQLGDDVLKYKGPILSAFEQDNADGFRLRGALDESRRRQDQCMSLLNEIAEIRELLGAGKIEAQTH